MSPEFHSSIKINLSHDLNSHIPFMREEINFGIKASIGDLLEWTSINPQMQIDPVVSMMTNRVFVGLPLSRDATWIGTTMNI